VRGYGCPSAAWRGSTGAGTAREHAFAPRARAASDHQRAGRLHRVSGAPEFRLPAYLCFPSKSESPALVTALDTIRRVASNVA